MGLIVGHGADRSLVHIDGISLVRTVMKSSMTSLYFTLPKELCCYPVCVHPLPRRPEAMTTMYHHNHIAACSAL